MGRKPLGVAPQFLRGSRFPMICAQHGAHVEQVAGRPASRIDQRAILTGPQTQAERITGSQALRQQRP